MKLTIKVDDGPKPQFGLIKRKEPLKIDNVSIDWGSESELVWL